MQIALFLLPLVLALIYAAVIVLRLPRPLLTPPPAPQRHQSILVNPEASVEAELEIELSDPEEFADLFRK